jgi:hypothetical protein
MRGRIARLIAAIAVLGVVAVPARATVADEHACSSVLVAFPVGSSSCPGVRPGALFFRPDGAGCSWSFIFRGSDGRNYAASAGHCIWAESNVGPAADKEEKWAPGEGMVVQDADGAQIGRFAYGVWNDDRDFSLVRLDSGVRPSASMCYFGGPTSMYTAHSATPVFLKHFGNGLLIGEVLPARTAIAEDTSDPLFVYALAGSAPGDSGSGVITSDGKAIGTLVGLDIIGETIITRLDASIERAEEKTGIRFTLQTAALEPDVVRL